MPTDPGRFDSVAGRVDIPGFLSILVKSHHRTRAYAFYMHLHQANVTKNPEPGHDLLILDASVTNTGRNIAFLYASRIRAVDDEGGTYKPEPIGAEGALPGYLQLVPGDSIDGFLMYHVPQDRKINNLTMLPGEPVR